MNKSNLLAGAAIFSILTETAPAMAEPQGGQVRDAGHDHRPPGRFNVASDELVKLVRPIKLAPCPGTTTFNGINF